MEENKYGTIGERKVAVPDGFFKAVLREDESGYHSIAFIFENNATRQPLKEAARSVDEVEALIGYDLFSNLYDQVENLIEGTVSWEEWL